jgi:hypothetical protein
MFCVSCEKDLEDCICLDKEQRIINLMKSPYIASKCCRICDKHYALCKCESPVWGMKSEGEWL